MEDRRKEVRLDIQEIKEGVLFAAISYLFCLWGLAFIFKKEDNRFVNFHLRQGIVIFMGEIVCLLLLMIPFIGGFFCRAGLFILFWMSICGMYFCFTGRMKGFSLIRDIAVNLVI